MASKKLIKNDFMLFDPRYKTEFHKYVEQYIDMKLWELINKTPKGYK